jgi:hypothetical protein
MAAIVLPPLPYWRETVITIFPIVIPPFVL